MPGTHSPRRARRALATVVAAGSALVALATAAPAQASTVGVTVGGSRVTCTSQRPELAGRLAQDIAGALHGRQDASALALYDRSTATSCTFRADAAFDSASVVKLTILGALLRQAAEAHRALTAHEVELTTAMITKSDNDSTNALWHQIGPADIRHFLTLAGMRDTVPGPNGYWGHTQVTAGDQMKLLRLLTSDNSVLDRNARAYALKLMNRVVPEQRWGAPAGAPTTATVHVKNGWLPRATNGWRVHSVGVFTGAGHDYGVVLLSHGNRTMNDGIAAIEGAARVIHRDLNESTAS